MITHRAVVDGKPTPLERARVGKRGKHAVVYESTESKRAKTLFALLAKKDGPQIALDHQVSVDLTFGMGPPPPSWPNWKREAALVKQVRCSTKPDIDNLAKFVLDALNGLWWSDDARIYALTVQKVYSDTLFTAVSATWMPAPTRKPK